MALSLVVLAYIFESTSLMSITIQILVLIIYIFFQLCFQSSVSVYSSLLRALSSENNSVAISGRGFALGQLGNVIALALLSPLVASGAVVLGLAGKPLALLLGPYFRLGLGYRFLSWERGW